MNCAARTWIKGAVDFDELRRENLDKDAVTEIQVKGIDFDELRQENLDKGAVDFDELRRENLDKDAAEAGAPWYEKLEEGVGL